MTRPWRAAIAVAAIAAAAVLAFRSVRAPDVDTVAAVEAPLVQTVVFSGRVAALVRVDLGATVTGRVAEVRVREGDAVREGAVLATLESAEARAQLEQAQAQLRIALAREASLRELARPTADAGHEQATANLEAARREARRTRELFERGYVAQARVDETERAQRVAEAQLGAARAAVQANAGGGTESAQARLRVEEARAALGLAQARLAQATLLAPADGRIVARRVDPGQIVQPGRTLFQFAETGVTELVGQADERFLARLAPGQSAVVVADAFPGEPFEARVVRIAPGVDAQRGTIEVRLRATAPPAFLREDMTLSMQVAVARRERALTLPAGAVIGPGAEAAVRRVDDGRVVERPVRVGARTPERVEVLEGLAAGDAVLADPLSVAPGARARARAPVATTAAAAPGSR